MRKQLSSIVLFVVALVTLACADPASDKPKATVGEAQPQSSAQQPAAVETLIVSPDNSKIEFVASKVTRSHQGSFKKFTGKIELVPNSVPDSRVSIDIDTASVETDTPELTAHLKTPDFFDVAKYPKATFVSTKIESNTSAGGNSYTVTGNFDLHGQSKSISFPATIEATPDKATMNAEFAINRRDFGIVYAGKTDDLIRDAVVIKLDLRVPRKK